jgi:hypothetical protein
MSWFRLYLPDLLYMISTEFCEVLCRPNLLISICTRQVRHCRFDIEWRGRLCQLDTEWRCIYWKRASLLIVFMIGMMNGKDSEYNGLIWLNSQIQHEYEKCNVQMLLNNAYIRARIRQRITKIQNMMVSYVLVPRSNMRMKNQNCVTLWKRMHTGCAHSHF